MRYANHNVFLGNWWSRCFLVPCVHQISHQKGQFSMEYQVKIGVLHRYFLRYEVNTQIFITIFFEKKTRQKISVVDF